MKRKLHDETAEKALVGAIMLGGDEIFDLAPVPVGDFFNFRHRDVYEAMAALREIERPVNDLTLLEAQLGEKIDQVGGLAGLTALLEVNPVTSNAEHYANAIREKAIERRMRGKLAELLASDLEGSDLVAEVQSSLHDVEDGVPDRTIRMREAIKNLFNEMGADGSIAGGISTGYEDLDAVLGGLRRGNVTILAGRPSHGKSALARSIAANVVAQGIGVHVFTPEDTVTTYAMRQVSDMSRVDLQKFATGKLSREDLHAISGHGGRLASEDPNWAIDDSSGVSAKRVSMTVRKHMRKLGTGLIVVDYVQQLDDPDLPRGDRQIQAHAAVRDLVSLARATDCAVLALSQLNRKCEERPNKRPILSDLRESGELEQDAFAVLMVYRDEVYNPDGDLKNITEVLIRKNKNGQTGSCSMYWDGPTATHRPLKRQER